MNFEDPIDLTPFSSDKAETSIEFLKINLFGWGNKFRRQKKNVHEDCEFHTYISFYFKLALKIRKHPSFWVIAVISPAQRMIGVPSTVPLTTKVANKMIPERQAIRGVPANLLNTCAPSPWTWPWGRQWHLVSRDESWQLGAQPARPLNRFSHRLNRELRDLKHQQSLQHSSHCHIVNKTIFL